MTDDDTTTAEAQSAVAVAEPAAEIQQYMSHHPVDLTTPALQRMAEEAAAMDIAFKMAQSLSKTNAVPQRYQQSYVPKGKSKPLGITAAYDLAAAILYGAELNMTALQAAQNVFSVHGQPAVYARTMVAQVRQWIDERIAKGLTTTDDTGDDVWEVEASPTKVVWAARRNGKTVSAEWTIQRAEQAGFTSNEKYQKQPTEMLRAKAMTEVCRILFQDVLLGMAYSVEELQLEDGTLVQRVVSQRPQTRGGVAGLEAQLAARRRPNVIEAAPDDPPAAPAATSEPEPAMPAAEQVVEPPEPPAADPTPPAEPPKASKRQLTDLKRLLATVEKMTDPKAADTLQFVGAQVDRDLTDLADLTDEEAARVITTLSTPIEGSK